MRGGFSSIFCLKNLTKTLEGGYIKVLKVVHGGLNTSSG